MNSAAVNGQQIAYDDTGGTGPAVLLAHGFLLDRTMFAAQVDALRPAFRIITWDERGFGETVWDGRPYNYWDLAADALGLLDHLGIDRAVLGGMSHGGFICLRAALTAPQRVRALLLLSTQAGTEDSDVAIRYQAMFDDWDTNGPTGRLVDTIAGLIIGEPELSTSWISKWKARTPRLTEQGRALLSRDNILHRLREITAAALVVHGTADVPIPMDKAEALSAGLSGSDGVVKIAGGAHGASLTHPEAVTAAIVSFLTALSE